MTDTRGDGGAPVAEVITDTQDRVSGAGTTITAPSMIAPAREDERGSPSVALIAVACRLPGCDSATAFWDAARNGRRQPRAIIETLGFERTRRRTPAHAAPGEADRAAEGVDATFFGLTERESNAMPRSQRVLLEVGWECIERAGYAPDRLVTTRCRVGVFVAESGGEETAGARAAAATLVSRHLMLDGPSVAVPGDDLGGMAAIRQAIGALRDSGCDMALAGGAAEQTGTPASAASSPAASRPMPGAALVLLKRLEDALRDGDRIIAIIRATTIDTGAVDVVADARPLEERHRGVIGAALTDAGVPAQAIRYVEALAPPQHGADAPAVQAFEQACRADADGSSGAPRATLSVVTADATSAEPVTAVTCVIAAAFALSNEEMPATPSREWGAPQGDRGQSTFTAHATRVAWPRAGMPRRAGVSASGRDGSCAFMVLEDAPAFDVDVPAPSTELLRLSARSTSALERAAVRLAAHLATHPEQPLGDVAFTLSEGRSVFTHRLCVAARTHADAVRALTTPDHALRAGRSLPAEPRTVIFTFPGQGAQYPDMGGELYESEPVFREACDTVFASLYGVTPFDLRQEMFGGGSAEALRATAVTQPAIFCLEFALGCLWLSRGVTPRAMIGHSVGEFVAAVLAGVMTVQDGARLVARRGAMMNALPTGAMLSVRLSANALESRVPASLAIAAQNGPSSCVVSGMTDVIGAFARELESEGVLCRLLPTSHAFHSSMMDPILDAFGAEVRRVPLSPPSVPIISTLTGTWLTAGEALDPAYWTRHLRETVRFSAAVETALGGPPTLFLEVGPRHTLSTLVKQHASPWSGEKVPATVASLTDGPMSERDAFVLAVGQLWLHGIDGGARPRARQRRVCLPTYPFERLPFVVDEGTTTPFLMPQQTVRRPSLTPRGSHAVHAITREPTPVSVTSVDVRTGSAHSPVPAPAGRRHALVSRLRKLIEDVAGVELDGTEPTASFVELGLDSLVLTQAAIRVRQAFGVPVTFRQLMEQFRSVDALAAHLEATLPPERAEAAVPTVQPRTTIPSSAPAASGPATDTAGSFAEQVIQQQLAIMEQQLALLSGALMQAAPAAMPAPSEPAIAPTAHASVTDASGAATSPQDASAAAADDREALAHTRYDVQKAFGAIARIHTRPGTELTARQHERLQAFVRSYTERTRGSKAYTARHRGHLADPRVVNGFRPQTKELCYQIVVERSKGCRVWDVDGNEYIDALNGFGMSLFGWQPGFITEAVKAQLDIGHEIGPQHPLAGEVASLVCDLTGFDRAGLCNTGSEAVMGAIRIARTVTARDLVVCFTGSYHGIFDEVLVRGTKARRAVPAAPGILQAAVENVLVLDYGTAESLEIIRARGHEIAAVLVEPVQSRRPDFQPVEFLRDLRRITEENGIVLIFDEVITGFRAHQRGAQGLFDIRADLATYGKVIGGGYPIGVIAGRREYMDALDGGDWGYGDDSIPSVGVTYFAGTFVRHPLALAACKAALTHLRDQGPTLQLLLTARTDAMVAEMNAIATASRAPLTIRSFASLWRITFTEDHPLQDLLWAMMRHRGVHILDNFPCFLTTAHSGADIAQIVAAFKGALAEMQASGFLPGESPAAVDSLVVDAAQPPAPNARLGRDRDGAPAWFVPDPVVPGQYLKLTT